MSKLRRGTSKAANVHVEQSAPTTAVPQLPNGSTLRLRVVARSDDTLLRDLYLTQANGGANSALLWASQQNRAQVLTLRLWCERLGVPVEHDPPGNMERGWTWPGAEPDDQPPTVAPDPSLVF